MKKTATAESRFHGYTDTELIFTKQKYVEKRETKYFVLQEREVGYQFFLHQHPYVRRLTQRLIQQGTSSLLAADTEYVKKADGSFETLADGTYKPTFHSAFFENAYAPNTALVDEKYPVEDLDFTSSGAYSIYNWELFFHVPLTVAIHLSKNQRFADAQRWFHYIFDPTDDSDGPTPDRFWKVRPFQYTDVKKIEEVLVNLATGADEDLRNETIRSIEAWKNAPFRPHVIARYRQQAYMYKTVMAYLDNLIAWGDSLFRQDTGEAVDEALMIYVLAAGILGPRPQAVPKKGSVRPQTYAALKEDLQEFGVVMRDVEADLPYDLMPFPSNGAVNDAGMATLRSIGTSLYFGVPRNDKLLGYWDTVADRLFKIRNSLNLQGVFRQLALFEPPIDPAMLARAAAAGLDVGAVVNGLNQPLPLVRFQLLVQKALELAQEVRSLGNALLTAMEKDDGEAMALLRARHERVMMEMAEQVKYAQLQDAVKAREGLLQTLANAVQRYAYYERQLGRTPDEIMKSVPELVSLDRAGLEKMKLKAEEPSVGQRDVDVNIVPGVDGIPGGLHISSFEAMDIGLSSAAAVLQTAAGVLDLAAGPLSLIPQAQIRVTPWGLGAGGTFGGEQLSRIAGFMASMSRTVAGALSAGANMSEKIGSWTRREQEWAFQSNTAAGEITQIYKQLRGAELREAVADLELRNHRQQMKHAREIERFMNAEGTDKNGKATNKALYAWMKREVKGLYGQSFQTAFDIAKKAERALQHELGNTEVRYVGFGYLAGKEGLLAGDKLYMDVKRMELSYLELNRREYELTKNASLLQLDPLALVQLRRTGRCTLRIPEAAFDLEGPGHYFRRIKNVAVTIPCVTGPYAGVSCTLTLLKSSIRKTSVLRDGAYARDGSEDERFSDYFGSMQSIVTSTGQNDSGLFETNLRDERYLPFENAGAVSEWQIELPADPSRKDPAQFDYSTITDVILHIRYTAREGGALLRNEAKKHVTKLIEDAQAPGTVRLFSTRHEFPSEWARFQAQDLVPNKRFELSLNLQQEHYPYWSLDRLDKLVGIDVIAESNQDAAPAVLNVFTSADTADASKAAELKKVDDLGGLLRGSLAAGAPPKPIGKVNLFFDSRELKDLWLSVTWRAES